MMYWAETTLTFVLAVAVMASVDWRLTLWALSPAPLVSIIVIFFGRRIHHRFERIQALFSDISSRVQENLNGARVLRAYAQDDAEMERFAALNRNYIAQAIKLARLSTAFMPLLGALIGLTFLVVLFVGGHRLMSGSLSLGSFVMFNSYLGTLIWPMIAFGWVVNLMERGTASLTRIMEIMREQPSIVAPTAPRAIGADTTLRFENVTVDFAASGQSRRALSEIDLTVDSGSVVAFVGRTGCGKSTLVNLIPRLFDPAGGRVTLGGHDLREYDPAALRSIIGYVPQETFLFSATLAENIAFGVPGASAERIEQAAEMAGLGPDLESFPLGLQTEVGERGLTLSGGQKQRAAIARAVARDPRILILDDALSAVDTITEERILTSLLGFMRGRTTILISHRVSTVRLADRIHVMDAGRIVESGTHDELLATGGYYAELYQKQLLEEELESI
jgi:ATP-binding cassette subfamily B protein